MTNIRPQNQFFVDNLKIQIYSNREQMGRAAAYAVGEKIRTILKTRKQIRVTFAAAPSQNEFLKTLTTIRDIEWSRITAFHMDEYVGLPADAPQGFGNFLRDRLFDKLPFKAVHYIDPTSSDKKAECLRYANLLEEAPIDIVCMGIGENGHIAFNDPPVADFNDPEVVKVVELDEICRQQQVNDGCFETIAQVPRQAISLTVPTLISADFIFVVVPGPTKAQAVYNTLKGPIHTTCPASILRNHGQAILYLDLDSAANIEKR